MSCGFSNGLEAVRSWGDNILHYSPNLIHLTPRSSLIGHPARKSYMRPHRVGVIPFGVSFVVLQSSVLL